MAVKCEDVLQQIIDSFFLPNTSMPVQKDP